MVTPWRFPSPGGRDSARLRNTVPANHAPLHRTLVSAGNLISIEPPKAVMFLLDCASIIAEFHENCKKPAKNRIASQPTAPPAVKAGRNACRLRLGSLPVSANTCRIYRLRCAAAQRRRPARPALRIPVPFLRDCRHAASCRMRLPIKGPSPFAASLSAIPAPTGKASPLPRFLLLSNMY